MNAFILTPDRVSKELSASAKSKGDSRECFIEVYTDNQSIFIIVYSCCEQAELEVGLKET